MSSPTGLTDRAASVLDADPRLARALRAHDALAVGRARLLPVLALPAGAWRPPAPEALGERACVLAVLDGLLLHDGTGVRGPGDLVDPWAEGGEWLACTAARLAVIGAAFAVALEPWPDVARLSRRPREAEVRLRAGDLVLDMLWRIAGRWALPAMGGLALPPVLGVAALACLAGLSEGETRTALAALEDRGAVARGWQRAWVLMPPGPGSPLREQLRAKAAEQCAVARVAQADTAALFERGDDTSR
jgi:hypothetical protein